MSSVQLGQTVAPNGLVAEVQAACADALDQILSRTATAHPRLTSPLVSDATAARPDVHRDGALWLATATGSPFPVRSKREHLHGISAPSSCPPHGGSAHSTAMTTTPLAATDPASYALGRSRAEADRLHLQHRIYGASTRGLLTAAGIGPGMRVLDIGSGAGDVAMLVAEMIGPSGEVVGVEVAPETIAIAAERAAAAGLGNIRFVEADLRDLDLDEDTFGTFDAVIGRWVLMYQPDPVGLLRRLASYLRPGGIVAFQESDLVNVLRPYPDAPMHARLRELMTPPTDRGGLEQQMGPKLYGAFIAAGLPAPELLTHMPVGGGPDWVGYRYIASTARSLLPAFAAMGLVTVDAIDLDTLEDQLRDEIVSTNGVLPLPTVYGAWTRLAG
jgi:SAM-dependent methyltransferase